MLTSKRIIGLKTETTQGSAATLTTTDYVEAFDIDLNYQNDILERKLSSSSLDRFPHLIGKKWAEVKFKIELKHSGTAATPYAPMSAILQAAGFTETVAANVTYAPSSAPAANFYGPGKSASIRLYWDGQYHLITGAMCDGKITLETGKPGVVEASFLGVYNPTTDVAIPSNAPNTLLPPVIKSATFTMHAYASIISKYEIAVGNTIAPKPDVNSANSLLGFQITGRNPSGSFDPEAVLVAAHDFVGKFYSGAEASASIVAGASAGNICTITTPKVQYGKPSFGDRDGILALEIPVMFNRSTGDDWISIVFS